jgi:serine/threonine protein kinase
MFYYLSRNILTTEQIVNYFTQLVRGVDYLHSNGVAHLDIKLENVMLDFKTKTIKLIDFGHATDKMIVSYLGGTHPYIAPEAFVSTRIETSKADIWALGVILYEFIFKDFLWERSEINDPEFKKFSENKQLMALDLIEDIHLQTVLKNTLKIDSETRFSSSDILKCMELVNTIEIEC